MTEMTVLIEGTELPGLDCQPVPGGPRHRNVHVALPVKGKNQQGLVIPGRPWLAAEPVPGDARGARWEVTVAIRDAPGGGFDFTGPHVRGGRTDRHLGLAWGDVPGDGTLLLFRGAKLRLADVPPGLVEQALRPGWRLVARVRMSDAQGNPVCARLRQDHLAWSAEPADGERAAPAPPA